MYLSALLIDVGSNPDRPRPGRLWLRNPYHVHQRLLMAFPSERRRQADPTFLHPFDPADFAESGDGGHVHHRRGHGAGVLFRVDPKPGRNSVIVVQSARLPDWGYAFANANHLLAALPTVREYSPSIAVGQRLRFRLRANPVKRRSADKRRVGLGREQLQPWLERQAAKAGFQLEEAGVRHVAWVHARKPRDRARMKFFSVLYEGVLEVVDPDAFTNALAAGIGPAKAFGFGLLSVVPTT